MIMITPVRFTYFEASRDGFQTKSNWIDTPGLSQGYVLVKLKLQLPSPPPTNPGISRAFDCFNFPGGGEFDPHT